MDTSTSALSAGQPQRVSLPPSPSIENPLTEMIINLLDGPLAEIMTDLMDTDLSPSTVGYIMGSCIRRISVEIIEEALSLMSDDERTSYLISSSEAQIALLEKLFVKKKGTTLTKLQEEKAVEIVKEYLESKKKD